MLEEANPSRSETSRCHRPARVHLLLLELPLQHQPPKRLSSLTWCLCVAGDQLRRLRLPARSRTRHLCALRAVTHSRLWTKNHLPHTTRSHQSSRAWTSSPSSMTRVPSSISTILRQRLHRNRRTLTRESQRSLQIMHLPIRHHALQLQRLPKLGHRPAR